MKLRIALFLSAAFLAAALALAVLPACSDHPREFACSTQWDGCYYIAQGGGDSGSFGDCICLPPADCGIDPDPPTAAECDAYCNNTCWTRNPDGSCSCDPCPDP
jgi:hypothetical protein